MVVQRHGNLEHKKGRRLQKCIWRSPRWSKHPIFAFFCIFWFPKTQLRGRNFHEKMLSSFFEIFRIFAKALAIHRMYR